MGSHQDRDEELLLPDKYLGYIMPVTYRTRDQTHLNNKVLFIQLSLKAPVI